eukprot:TRINITY_DN56839_c0_g1_i1.p1 TRINITY_DN56839_c0_g1~~TRINITY_DN56839_c0_g1_i1.p1  ORF type:complete len:660 (+),score=78.08 TRINITY_DN56839_c0_g1_i1:32-1981(+)
MAAETGLNSDADEEAPHVRPDRLESHDITVHTPLIPPDSLPPQPEGQSGSSGSGGSDAAVTKSEGAKLPTPSTTPGSQPKAGEEMSSMRRKGIACFLITSVLSLLSALVAFRWHHSLVHGQCSLVAEVNHQEMCHTALPGEVCYDHVRWAKESGINIHPEWYAMAPFQLTSQSSPEEFQEVLHETRLGSCPEPCHHTAPVGNCLTAPFGSRCYKRVMWVARSGIFEHPEWYPNVNILSSMTDVQEELHKKGESGCTKPCPAEPDPSWVCESQHAEAQKAAGVCNPNVTLLDDGSSAEWLLSDADQGKCFRFLLSTGFVKLDMNTSDRNWCWAALKEYGCHNHMYDKLSWQEMQMQAAVKGAPVPSSFSPIQNADMCDRREFGGRVDWSWAQRFTAQKWFNENVHVYVLSLPSSWQRRQSATTCFSKLGIKFKFVDGVDMRIGGALERAKQEGLIPWSYNLALAQKVHDDPAQRMSDGGSITGTVGCASGHFRAQRQGLQETEKKPLSLVFEDDVCGTDDLVQRVWRLVTQELPCDWQVVSLYSRCPFGRCVSPHLTRVQPDINEPAWRCRHGVNYGMQGTLYRLNQVQNLQKLWQPVVFNESRPHCIDLDVALASISNHVKYYAVPASQSPGFLRELPEGSARWDINSR